LNHFCGSRSDHKDVQEYLTELFCERGVPILTCDPKMNQSSSPMHYENGKHEVQVEKCNGETISMLQMYRDYYDNNKSEETFGEKIIDC